MHNTIRKQIFEQIDTDYQKFSSALIPTNENILGVRMPALRKLAKGIAKDDWRTYLQTANDEYFEEVMLQGLVIGYVKADIEELLTYVEKFVPKIDNWSVCDSFCSGLKMTKQHKERVWSFLQPYVVSENEYELRFGIVMLLVYYIESDYIDRVLGLLNHVQHEGYYVKMAVAWALSSCFVKLPDPTLDYLAGGNSLDVFTYNKALQKITELTRVDQETKQVLRSMKRR
ncbi:DNA alkylation repair protein [Sporosarcina sp. P2]|uniref:DNA alkylation repair protein n=1 Tax=unclassified Sporosarcina TaxID=2647733 RepID=UPI000C171511|nr:MULTISPECIES: DNA alkylation repair protein [unclassified Sporosarcina]PIC69680.1 DNA alkylation repair protein [Sporosarcina sp. P16b]PID03096.1 DNA alkylation repair protein [Sporosarcina sp. P2]